MCVCGGRLLAFIECRHSRSRHSAWTLTRSCAHVPLVLLRRVPFRFLLPMFLYPICWCNTLGIMDCCLLPAACSRMQVGQVSLQPLPPPHPKGLTSGNNLYVFAVSLGFFLISSFHLFNEHTSAVMLWKALTSGFFWFLLNFWFFRFLCIWKQMRIF